MLILPQNCFYWFVHVHVMMHAKLFVFMNVANLVMIWELSFAIIGKVGMVSGIRDQKPFIMAFLSITTGSHASSYFNNN